MFCFLLTFDLYGDCIILQGHKMLYSLIMLMLIDNTSWRTTYFPSLQHQPRVLHNNTACIHFQPCKKNSECCVAKNTNLFMHAPHISLVLLKAPDSSSLKGDFPCHCCLCGGHALGFRKALRVSFDSSRCNVNQIEFN